MKTKLLFLLFLSICMVICGNLHANNQNDNKQIDLSGDLPDNQLRRSVNSKKIIAIQTEMDIQVLFTEDIGVFNIQIIDESNNPVYQNEVNTIVSTSLLINTLDLSNGSYLIRFNNSQGQYLEGDFIIQ